ncbi:hypothetical protein V8D89_007019 [Ganoderma adspersum]
MDNSLYKTTSVRRGHTYRYYFSPPASQQQPVLLFLHGFPSTSYDWRRQIAFFQPLGYGIIAPDLLGAGGTSKPLDPKEFRLNALADDVLDILDKEGIKKVVSVSHDWGSVLAARLCMLYPEICDGFVWLGLAFMDPPTAPFEMEAAMAAARAAVGYDAYAYWEFFTRPDAHEAIEKNVDAFLQLLYPEDPKEWMTWILTRGKTAELVEGNIQLGKPSYLPEEVGAGTPRQFNVMNADDEIPQEYQALREDIVSNGIRSALNWYNAQVQNVHLEDNINIPEERKKVVSPSLVCLAQRDPVSVSALSRALMTKYGTKVDFVEVDAAHWLQVERSDEVNAAMQRWLDTLAARPSFDVWRKQTTGKGPPGFTACHAIGAGKLARLTGEDTLLPVALLACCGLDEAIVRGRKREAGRLAQAALARRHEDRGRGRDVPAHLLVGEDLGEVREQDEGVFGPRRARVLAQGFYADVRDRLCKECWAMVQDRDLAERRKTWNRLPELLGITVDGWGRP